MTPFAALLWCVGWSLYWVGQAEEKLKQRLSNQTEKSTFSALFPHPKLKIRNRGYAGEAPEKHRIQQTKCKGKQVFES